MALFSWVYLEQEKKAFVVFDLVSAYLVSDNELVAELGFAPGLSASHVAWLSVGFFASRVFSVVELSNSTGADTDTRLDAASCSASKCSVGMCSGGGASLSLSLPGADDAGPAVVSGGRDGPRRASSGLFTSADLS